MHTLQVEVLGAHGGLRGDFGVNLDRVEIVSVSGYVHVVPVVVIQRTVRVSFDQVCSVAQVRDVVEVAGKGTKKGERRGLKHGGEKMQINRIHDEEQHRVTHFRAL